MRVPLLPRRADPRLSRGAADSEPAPLSPLRGSLEYDIRVLFSYVSSNSKSGHIAWLG